MQSVSSENVVMTDLWRIASDKSLSCILGDMESCETEEIVIDTNSKTDNEIVNSFVKIVNNNEKLKKVSISQLVVGRW